eukprot:610780-Alexandrium_andersonii.AAC.1
MQEQGARAACKDNRPAGGREQPPLKPMTKTGDAHLPPAPEYGLLPGETGSPTDNEGVSPQTTRLGTAEPLQS